MNTGLYLPCSLFPFNESSGYARPKLQLRPTEWKLLLALGILGTSKCWWLRGKPATLSLELLSNCPSPSHRHEYAKKGKQDKGKGSFYRREDREVKRQIIHIQSFKPLVLSGHVFALSFSALTICRMGAKLCKRWRTRGSIFLVGIKAWSQLTALIRVKRRVMRGGNE